MAFCFYAAVCIGLAIVQTSVFLHSGALIGFFDIAVPFLVSIGLYRRARLSLPVAAFMGYLMDNLSGGPFGLYMTVYVWLILGILWVARFLQAGNPMIHPLLVVVGVFFQNALFLGTSFLLRWEVPLSFEPLHVVGYQLLWAFITAPLSLAFFGLIHYRIDAWQSRRVHRNRGHLG